MSKLHIALWFGLSLAAMPAVAAHADDQDASNCMEANCGPAATDALVDDSNAPQGGLTGLDQPARESKIVRRETNPLSHSILCSTINGDIRLSCDARESGL